jgi:hypothetical protein
MSSILSPIRFIDAIPANAEECASDLFVIFMGS